MSKSPSSSGWWGSSSSSSKAREGRALGRYRLRALGLFFLTFGWAAPAWSWSASGHMQIALLAYDGLPHELRQRLVDLLREHPRFADDFLPLAPPELKADTERDRWLFAHASTWPDLARGQPAYERGTWHYVNLPLYLRQGALSSCAQARKAFPASVRAVAAQSAARQAAGGEPIPSGDSIREALPNARRTLGDERALPSERALALSWVLHLVGDAHQPLHGVALFTEHRFVTGDRGGNDISIEGRGSLHRVWDGLLGEETSPAALQQKVDGLRGDPRLMKLGAAAARDQDPDRWLDEGCELARRAVYVPAILSAVGQHERERREGKPELKLRQSYVNASARTARVRAVQAAARLARLLEQLLRRQNVRHEPQKTRGVEPARPR